MQQADTSPETTSDPPPVAAQALIVHSADDEMDNPVIPVLIENDGIPSRLGQALWTLVRRDGYDNALTLLSRGGRWSRIDPDTVGTDAGSPVASAGTEVVTAGYGIHHVPDDVTNLARIEAAMDAQGVWWYVVERHGMLIEYRANQHRSEVVFVEWTAPNPAWAEFDTAPVARHDNR
jgi:hypothetical protein